MSSVKDYEEKFLDIWQDPAKEIGELVLDEAIDDAAPLLAKIPLLSLVSAAIKSGRAWSDYLLAKKVQHFYQAWEQLNKKERREIYEKFAKKPRAFTEKLLFILTQQEDLQKCKLLGLLTVEYLRGAIRRGDFYDLIETVNRLSRSDLEKLSTLLNKSMLFPVTAVGERYANLFITRGLVATERRVPAEQREDDETIYKLTPLGRTLAKVAVKM